MAEKNAKRWRVKTLAEVAAFFGVSPETVRHWRGAGLPGKAGCWELSAIVRWRVARAGRERKRPAGDGARRADANPRFLQCRRHDSLAGRVVVFRPQVRRLAEACQPGTRHRAEANRVERLAALVTAP